MKLRIWHEAGPYGVAIQTPAPHVSPNAWETIAKVAHDGSGGTPEIASRIKSTLEACAGLDLPASVPVGILADAVHALKMARVIMRRFKELQDSGDIGGKEWTEYGMNCEAIESANHALDKLNPAPVSTEPRGIHFTSCGYLSIRTPDGSRRDYRGTTREEHERHAAEIRETIARQTRSLETLQAYLDGATEESPAALQQRADV